MDNYNEQIESSWITTVVLALLGMLLLIFGIWSLHRGQVSLPSKFSGLLQFNGIAAEFVAGSIIALSGLFFTFAFLFKNKKLLNIFALTFLILTLVLSAIGFLY